MHCSALNVIAMCTKACTTVLDAKYLGSVNKHQGQSQGDFGMCVGEHLS